MLGVVESSAYPRNSKPIKCQIRIKKPVIVGLQARFVELIMFNFHPNPYLPMGSMNNPSTGPYRHPTTTEPGSFGPGYPLHPADSASCQEGCGGGNWTFFIPTSFGFCIFPPFPYPSIYLYLPIISWICGWNIIL
jgi:hypothetical protein